MEDQTRIMDEGTPQYPLDPATAVAAEACPHCAATIHVGEQFCPKCGYQRGTWQEGLEEDDSAASVESLCAARFTLVSSDGERYPLHDGETLVGRGEADIQLSDGFISRQHCKLSVSQDSITIIDLGSANGSFVDGERISPDTPVQLQTGSIVKLGQLELTIEAAESEVHDTGAEELVETHEEAEAEEADKEALAGEEPVASEELVTNEEADEAPGLEPAHMELTPAGSPWALARGDTAEVFYLPFGGSRLGRKSDKCDIVVLGDGYISGLHCRLVAGEDHLEVTDLGSTNGTHVNHERVAPDQTVTLVAGDVLRIGQTDLTVQYEVQDETGESEQLAEDSDESSAGE